MDEFCSSRRIDMLRKAIIDLDDCDMKLKIVFEVLVMHTSLGVPGIPDD